MVETHTVHQKHNAILKLKNEIRSFKIRFYTFDYQFYHRLDLVLHRAKYFTLSTETVNYIFKTRLQKMEFN